MMDQVGKIVTVSGAAAGIRVEDDIASRGEQLFFNAEVLINDKTSYIISRVLWLEKNCLSAKVAAHVFL